MSSKVIVAILIVDAVIAVAAFTDWSYKDPYAPAGEPTRWRDEYPKCGGELQSPIDIGRTSPQGVGPGFDFVRGYRRTPDKMTLTNDGNTLVLTSEGGPPILKFNDDRLFQLDNVHFHWGQASDDGSEHALEGKRYALESQAVHNRVNSDGTLVDPPEAVIIVTLYKERSKVSYNKLQTFIDRVKEVVEPGSSVDIEPFLWPNLVSLPENNFYKYDGSLTNPPCTEATIFIAGKLEYVKNTQLDFFRMLMGKDNKTMAGNNRPLQHRNDREVISST